MKTTELNYQIALTLLKGIGPKKARHLISKLGGIEPLFKESISAISKKAEMNPILLKQMNREKALEEAKYHETFIEKHQVKPLFYSDAVYPQRLKQCSDAPTLLFQQGNANVNHERIVAIVGTRYATEYGKSICEEIIEGFVGKNILVVSGLAYGIDICVHQLCLKHSIPTYAVLGHGLDRVYPYEHKTIARRMLQNGGLLTEYLPGTKPDRENFPMRNRIVAGMSDATIVIESKESGGSLITAELANDYSRDVFAIPGNVGQIHSKGCNLLISKQKAHLITGSKDFLTWMQWDKEEKPKLIQRSFFTDFSEDEQKITTILETEGEQNIDMLAIKATLPVSKTSVYLFNLEIAGVVKALPGKKFKII